MTTALIDERIAPALSYLRDNRRPENAALAISSLFTVIESLVLYDTCEVSYWAIDDFGWPISDPLLGPFIDAGILRMTEHRDDSFIDQIRERDDRIAILDAAMNVRHAHAALRDDLHYVPAICAGWHLTADMLDHRRAVGFEGDGAKRVREVVNSIIKGVEPGRLFERSYQLLRDKMNAEIDAVIAMGAAIPVRIPPITATVLSDAANLDEIARKALDLREELAGYRARMASFLAEIDRPMLTVKAMRDCARDLNADIDRIVRRESRDFLGVVPLVPIAALATAAATQAPAVGIAATSLVAQVLGDLKPGAWTRRRKLAFLSEIAHRFSRVTDYGGLIRKHFGHAPSRAEFEAVEGLARLGRTGMSTL